MTDQKKITNAALSLTIMNEIEGALVDSDSFAFTKSQVPILVPLNRSGSIIGKKSAITVFVVAVGDTDAIEEFRKTRNAFQSEIGAVRATEQAKKMGLK